MNLLKISNKGAKLRKVLRDRGPVGMVAAAARYAFPPKPKTFAACKAVVDGKRGLEVGGPSQNFSREGIIPVYPLAEGLDNCNFGARTVWEGSITEGFTFQYDPTRPKGRQYVAEGSDLRMIPDGTYDFVISNHCIEHTANPIQVLKEWQRVVHDEGRFLIVAPHKQESFDHRRPITTLEHLIADYKNHTGEDDLTHLEEVLKLHDFDRNWRDSSEESFHDQCRNNEKYRRIHHHVFDTMTFARMVDYAGLQMTSVEALKTFHIIVTAKKLPAGTAPKNEAFISPSAEWRKTSPFRIDRKKSRQIESSN